MDPLTIALPESAEQAMYYQIASPVANRGRCRRKRTAALLASHFRSGEASRTI
jgi:hypothetical protein